MIASRSFELNSMHGGKSTLGGARIPLITRSRMMNVSGLVCGLVTRLLSAVSWSHRCRHGERVGVPAHWRRQVTR